MFKKIHSLLARNKVAPAADDSTRQKGQSAEAFAEQYLIEQGLKLISRNYSCPYGEIDLIMTDAACWVFVEVRYRNNVQFGGGIESVDSRKQQKLINTAEHYMQREPDHFDSCRFDVIALSGPLKHVKIEWIKDAFCA